MKVQNNSILNDVKLFLGLPVDYTPFDQQLIMLINASFSTLHQLGVGPKNGFEVVDNMTTWDEVVTHPRLNMIKQYICFDVKMAFDAPTSSIAANSINEKLKELQWRITSEMEVYGV